MPLGFIVLSPCSRHRFARRQHEVTQTVTAHAVNGAGYQSIVMLWRWVIRVLSGRTCFCDFSAFCERPFTAGDKDNLSQITQICADNPINLNNLSEPTNHFCGISAFRERIMSWRGAVANSAAKHLHKNLSLYLVNAQNSMYICQYRPPEQSPVVGNAGGIL